MNATTENDGSHVGVQRLVSPPSGKQVRLRTRKHVAHLLHFIRPKVFDAGKPKVLAIGVHRQIMEMVPELTDRQSFEFLIWWTRRREYLKAVIADNSFRYHASGRRSTKVTDKQREFAIGFLRKRKAKMKRVRKAKKDHWRAKREERKGLQKMDLTNQPWLVG